MSLQAIYAYAKARLLISDLQLIPPEGISLQAHAKTLLANELSLDAFEEHLMSFIEGVLFAHPNPMYAQLESGKVDGLSQKETQAMREAVHIM